MKTLIVTSLLFAIQLSLPVFGQEGHEHHHGAMPEKTEGKTESPEGMKDSEMNVTHAHPMGPSDCGDMEVWDYGMGMCMPLPMAGMQMKMLMVHGNSFLTQTWLERPRGKDAFSVPNMFMVDIGTSIGDRHYLNLDFMGTLERWAFPESGYPELLQIGEEQRDGTPFLDAQHPHSSPIMGLTLSDTISLGRGKDHLKLWFSPRGQSTDGPIAFMHRPTGMVNPDAPLGHHIGQDVGHITSTVIGASARLTNTTIEVSTFNGQEPEPTKVDLPMGTPNSYGARLIQQFSPHLFAMGSVAYIKEPEHHDPDLDHIWRYSASVYGDSTLGDGWMMHNSLIWGLVNFYDNTGALNSFAEEFWFHKNAHNIWGRLEVLERTAAELQIPSADANDGLWVTAATAGYTRTIGKWDGVEVGLGGSVTKYLLPSRFRDAYGGDPIGGKVFLQVGGMKMWNL